MTLEELLEMLDIYQDLQLIGAKTGDALSPVTYIADTGANLATHHRDTVHGISAGVTKEGEAYLKIMVDNVL